ncbi:MAG TPA: aminoglycoside phosphotransferase family protein [Candidatus Paceibacterota bacterium]|nr:aminoglycoside phosphotransferase family protein [Candidatus Paceibacterota bacterium]
MSTFKTTIGIEEVNGFLRQKFAGGATEAVFIKGGEVSQAFAFDSGGKNYILRVNRHNQRGFEKDRYAHEHFASVTVPIPKIHEIGKIGDNFYALSERAPGETLLNLVKGDVESCLQSFLSVLDELHSRDVSLARGYGLLDERGIGESSSWNEAVLSIEKQDWGKRFEETFMEKSLYESLLGKLKELVVYCPEHRSLVHGDYSFDNVLSDGSNVTGVIDWAQSMYGDFLYDIAWVSFWPSSMDYVDRFKDFYTRKGSLPPHFHERVLCYQVWIALNSLGFYAYSNQRDKYEWAKSRIFSLLRR